MNDDLIFDLSIPDLKTNAAIIQECHKIISTYVTGKFRVKIIGLGRTWVGSSPILTVTAEVIPDPCICLYRNYQLGFQYYYGDKMISKTEYDFWSRVNG